MSEPILAAIEKLQRERDEARADLAIVDGLSAELCKIYNEISADLDEAREELAEWKQRCLAHSNACEAMEYRRERDEWKEKYIQQNKDLGCEMMDPNGTIWDHAKKLQREVDRLKSLLTKWMGGVSISRHGYVEGLQRERDELREAIRETIMENLHLADGDDCTLKMLKDAIGFDLDSENA